MTDISSLLSRVRAASGPDNDLDIDIGVALAGWRRGRVTLDPFSFTENPDGDIIYGENTFWIADGGIQPLSFTESIDAAVALVERVLPGCDWKISTLRHRKGFGADLYPSAADAVARADAATAPLAILAALLSALEQKESTG